jgi:hypothetical protein
MYGSILIDDSSSVETMLGERALAGHTPPGVVGLWIEEVAMIRIGIQTRPIQIDTCPQHRTWSVFVVVTALLFFSASAFAQPVQTASLPVVVNVLKGTTQTESLDIPGILNAASDILGQAKIKLVQSGSVRYSVSDSGNDDGHVTGTECTTLIRRGKGEVAMKGLKIFIGRSYTPRPSFLGGATHATIQTSPRRWVSGLPPIPVVFLFPRPQTPSNTVERGRIVAHEVAHALTLGAYHPVTPTQSASITGHVEFEVNGVQSSSHLMYPRSAGGTILTPSQIDEIQTGARRLGAVSTISPGGTGGASKAFFSDPVGDTGSCIVDFSGVTLIHDGLTAELIVSLDLDVLFLEDEWIAALYRVVLNTDDSDTGDTIDGFGGIDAVIEINVHGTYPFDAESSYEAVLYDTLTGESRLLAQGGVARTQLLIDVVGPEAPPEPVDISDAIVQFVPFGWLADCGAPLSGGVIGKDLATGETDQVSFALPGLASACAGEIETDEFPDSWAEITLSLPPLFDQEVITFTGPATVEVFFDGAEGEATDTDGDGRDQVATQMVEMELVGVSKLLGPMAMRLHGDTFGEIEETENLTAGILDLPPFAGVGTAFSYFDVLFEVELLQPPDFVKLFAPNLILLHNEEPVHMTVTIDHKPPPLGATYSGELADPVSLYDDAGNLIGVTITDCVHSPSPSPLESTLTWADVIWTYELPLCWTLCTRQRLCRGLLVEVMLEKFDAYLDSDLSFMTPELHLHASIIKGFLEHATAAEIEQLACTFANAYLETEPCKEGSPCMQD